METDALFEGMLLDRDAEDEPANAPPLTSATLTDIVADASLGNRGPQTVRQGARGAPLGFRHAEDLQGPGQEFAGSRSCRCTLGKCNTAPHGKI